MFNRGASPHLCAVFSDLEGQPRSIIKLQQPTMVHMVGTLISVMPSALRTHFFTLPVGDQLLHLHVVRNGHPWRLLSDRDLEALAGDPS